MTKRKALVVVMGDLARSPRMQYHCLSLENNNYHVTVLSSRCGASKDDKAREELESNKNIQQLYCDETINLKKYLPSVLAYVIRPIWQFCILAYLFLFYVPLTHVIIVQNPPSIPILPFLYLYSRLLRIKLVVDWHNYGYSIMSLNLRPDHPIVKVYKYIEFFFGRRADAGFCVSEAMRLDLQNNHNVTYPLHVLYDKPPIHFKSLNLREKHNFFLKIQNQIPAFKAVRSSADDTNNSTTQAGDSLGTRFTMPDVLNRNVIRWRPDRPAIIMTSTSWTEDEDFDLLYETLDKYNHERAYQLADPDVDEYSHLPSLVCVITGKGPLKEHYETKIKENQWKHVEVVLPWLSAADYAKMVASSDVGICLHKSSSGVDLPMKVVDMFGCGVPVLAYNYPAIGELVIEDFYGLTFNSLFECCTKLYCLMTNFNEMGNCSRDDVDESPLARYRKNIKRRFLLSRWEDNWNHEAKPVLDRLIKHKVRLPQASENVHNKASKALAKRTTMYVTRKQGKQMPTDNPLWHKIDQITRGQVYHAQKSIEQDGWQLFAEDGQMKLYTRELEIDGLVCDPLKAVHIVKNITGFEMCHRFFNPDYRFEWEETLESMKVVEEINKDTLLFHQIHKRIWPAAQRDAVFWSHIRKIDPARASCLSKDDVSPVTRPDLKLHNIWIVCNDSTDKPDIPLESCVRVKLTVSLVCETYIPVDSNPETITREQLICKIIYSSTINPGGWAPAALLRAVYKREYPKFLDNFSNYVVEANKSSPIVFE